MAERPNCIRMTSICSYLSLALHIELYKRRSMGWIGILRQESHKEMAMNYEILFVRAQNQLRVAGISLSGGTVDIKGSIFSLQSAGSLLNTNISSRISERFFKQISFHAKFTFSAMSRATTTRLPAYRHRRKYLCNFYYRKRKDLQVFSFVRPLPR